MNLVARPLTDVILCSTYYPLGIPDVFGAIVDLITVIFGRSYYKLPLSSSSAPSLCVTY